MEPGPSRFSQFVSGSTPSLISPLQIPKQMAIFGNISWSYKDGRGRVQLYSNPLESAIVNNGFGALYIILIIVSCVFNPLVFV